MELKELKTWDELQDYLLERMDYADDKLSKANKSFTREQMWNMYIRDCTQWKGQDLPRRTKDILIKRIKKDFNQTSL